MSAPEPICVVGLWHLGSVLSACWAELGHRVVGVDSSPDVVALLRSGRAPLFEPGLDEFVQRNVHEGRLTFATDLQVAVPGAAFVFVAFDTPVDGNDRLDLSAIDATIERLAPLLSGEAIVIVSSQVPVGTCDRWLEVVRNAPRSRDVSLVYSPENLRLGDAIRCYLHPDRIVLGAADDATRRRVTGLFAPMKAPIVSVTPKSAEMAKHALNSFLATSVSFINEVATLCEVAGADVLQVAEALKTDPRIGPRAFLSPGFGFAGGTLARDLRVLQDVGERGGVETPLLGSVLEVNRRRPDIVLRRLSDLLGRVDGVTIGVLGLTYKAGTSTLRRSVALDVIHSLVTAGAKVRAFDPKADLSELPVPPEFEPVADAAEAARGASALVVLTEWPEFRRLDFDRLKTLMAGPVIFDGKNVLADLRLDERGFRYMGVGR